MKNQRRLLTALCAAVMCAASFQTAITGYASEKEFVRMQTDLYYMDTAIRQQSDLISEGMTTDEIADYFADVNKRLSRYGNSKLRLSAEFTFEPGTSTDTVMDVFGVDAGVSEPSVAKTLFDERYKTDENTYKFEFIPEKLNDYVKTECIKDIKLISAGSPEERKNAQLEEISRELEGTDDSVTAAVVIIWKNREQMEKCVPDYYYGYHYLVNDEYLIYADIPVSEIRRIADGYSSGELEISSMGCSVPGKGGWTVDSMLPSVNDNESKGARCYEPGDVNNDGSVDLSDLTELSIELLGEGKLSSAGKVAADVNSDGILNLADLAKVRVYLTDADSVVLEW